MAIWVDFVKTIEKGVLKVDFCSYINVCVVFNESSDTGYMQNNHAQMFIVSAPSGAGKTSLVRRSIKELKDLTVAVSHTTRPQRPAEQDGTDCLLYTSPSPRDKRQSRMPSSA